tara:strand:- start:1304 stop:2341 length:1038 start_codon:yes stop_codon:yes gene_type:complete
LKHINKKLNLGIVGCGRISSKHIGAIYLSSLKNKINIKAICDKKTAKAKIISKKYKINFYENMIKMAQEEDLDMISILTESGNHSKHFLELAKYVKYFVIEKPLSLKSKDALKIYNTAKKNGNKVFVVKQNRFNPSIKKLKEAINQGRFGKIFLGTARVRWSRDEKYYNLAKWRGKHDLDGGVIGNQASHHVDMLIWLMGEIKSVSALGKRALAKIESFDTVIANLRFKSGALGVLEATTATRPKDLEGSISILGSKGSVQIGGFSMNLVDTWQFSKMIKSDESIFKHSTMPKSVYGFGHLGFYESVLNSLNTKKVLHPQNAIHTVKVIEAINKSAILGGKTIYL